MGIVQREIQLTDVRGKMFQLAKKSTFKQISKKG